LKLPARVSAAVPRVQAVPLAPALEVLPTVWARAQQSRK